MTTLLPEVSDNKKTPYITLMQNLLKDLNTEYQTISSLQNLIKQLDALPKADLPYGCQQNINEIKNLIKGFGPEDRLVTRRQEEILRKKLGKCLPLPSYVKQEAIPISGHVISNVATSLTFERLVGAFLRDFYGEFTYVRDLDRIISEIDKLSEKERSANANLIADIKSTIKSYYYCYGSGNLPRDQLTTLHKKLCKIAGPPYDFSDYEEMEKFYDKKDVSVDASKYTIYKKTVKKIDKEDYIYDIVNTLITNFRRNCLSSHFTIFVQDYFENLQILSDSIDQYVDILDAIQSCLVKGGWEMTGGFKCEPDRISLVKDLQEIMDLYF